MENTDITTTTAHDADSANSAKEAIFLGLCVFAENQGVVSAHNFATGVVRALEAGYDGVPEDHSWNHIKTVLQNALGAFTGDDNYKGIDFMILIISALAHDISDDKFAKARERWEAFLKLLRDAFAYWMQNTHQDTQPLMSNDEIISAIEFVVGHIGVSKEATPAYTQVRSCDQWIELAKAESPSHYEMLLNVRHTVSSADIVEALGANGNTRAVTHNTRLCERERDGVKLVQGTPEFNLALFEGVTWVHQNKHAKLTQWIHNIKLHQVAVSRWGDMVTAYEEWATALGFTPAKLLLLQRGY
jgi:hypothetical protein